MKIDFPFVVINSFPVFFLIMGSRVRRIGKFAKWILYFDNVLNHRLTINGFHTNYFVHGQPRSAFPDVGRAIALQQRIRDQSRVQIE